MAENKFLVAPSEYTGEGWLTGRVVLLRLLRLGGGQWTQTPAGKGTSGGEGTDRRQQDQGERLKCEVHLLGGMARGEVVFCEAWGEAAGWLHTLAKSCETEGKLLCLSNVKIVRQYKQYSTSRLPYYVLFNPPKGQAEMVEPEGRWADIPGHHPFLDIEKMTKVESNQQHCVVGARCQTPLKQHPIERWRSVKRHASLRKSP